MCWTLTAESEFYCEMLLVCLLKVQYGNQSQNKKHQYILYQQ